MLKVRELSDARIMAGLTTRRIGRPTLYFPVTGSTNDVARQQAEAGAGDGLVVVTDEQTAGRGRLDRTWWAPPGQSLLFSLLLRPRLAAPPAGTGAACAGLPLAHASWLTMCLGLATVEAIEQVTGLRAALKWPNDILLQGRKLAGMLAELAPCPARLDPPRLDYAVLGLGINVNWTAAPPEVAQVAISLAQVLGHPVDRLTLLAAILASTEGWVDRVLAGESPVTAWAGRLATLGQAVAVSTAAGPLHGVAVGVTPEGGLQLRTSNGELLTIWSGDVSAVRAEDSG